MDHKLNIIVTKICLIFLIYTFSYLLKIDNNVIIFFILSSSVNMISDIYQYIFINNNIIKEKKRSIFLRKIVYFVEYTFLFFIATLLLDFINNMSGIIKLSLSLFLTGIIICISITILKIITSKNNNIKRLREKSKTRKRH